MKRKILFLSLILSGLYCSAQHKEISFEKTSFVAIKGKAKKENKLLFIDAYTSWCGPCKSEMASIEEVSKQFKDDIIFLLASDEDTSKIQTFLTENKFDLNFIHLDVPFIDAYIVELPTTILIDRNGQLVLEEEGFRIWTQQRNVESLKKLVKKL